ncbi:MAG: TetR/AcrR family transcriptional regulator [bacterium]
MKKSDETKTRILEVSLRLFNALGTGEVSTNHIASTAGMSPGNLYYHYRNKEEIIREVVERMIGGMEKLWQAPEGSPLESRELRRNLAGTFTLMWEYRFFCREMNVLLRRDEQLRNRYQSARDRQFQQLRTFLGNLFKKHDLSDQEYPEVLDNFIRISRLVGDCWLSCVDVEGRPVDSERIEEGVDLMLEIFRPYLYPDAFSAFARKTPL